LNDFLFAITNLLNHYNSCLSASNKFQMHRIYIKLLLIFLSFNFAVDLKMRLKDSLKLPMQKCLKLVCIQWSFVVRTRWHTHILWRSICKILWGAIKVVWNQVIGTVVVTTSWWQTLIFARDKTHRDEWVTIIILW